MGKVIAVCISEKKGTQKHPVEEAEFVEDWGIKNEAFRARGAEVEDGAFGENLVVQGFDFSSLPVGTRFRCGEVVLEMTQIGKECHHGCAIFQKMGDCIMPREGVFTRVLHGGSIRAGMEFEQIDGVNRDESL